MPPVIYTMLSLIIIAAALGYWFDGWKSALASAGITLVVVVTLAGLLSTIVKSQYGTGCWDTQLVALGSNTLTSGSFFLGSGTLNDEPTYEFLWDDGTGRIYEGHVTSDGSEGPVSVVEEENRTDGFVRICPPHNLGWTRWIAFGSQNDGWDGYEFHIPAGSVRRGFDVGVGG